MFRFNGQFRAICIGDTKENDYRVRNRIKKRKGMVPINQQNLKLIEDVRRYKIQRQEKCFIFLQMDFWLFWGLSDLSHLGVGTAAGAEAKAEAFRSVIINGSF